LAGKTTEITNKSSYDAEMVENQLAGKTAEITNKSSDDTERVEIQSARKTTKITNKSSEDAMRYDAMRTNIHEADQAAQKRGNRTSDISIAYGT
jgi:predicted oxidoreductase